MLQATQDITVSAPLSGGLNFVNQTAGERVVFQAGRDIAVFSQITTAGADIYLEADSPHSPAGGGDGTGQVRINAAISTRGGGAAGGLITLIGGGNPVNGGFDIASNVLAGTGGIQISLSAAGSLDLGVGAPGATQLSSADIAQLQSTGALVIGRATSGGDDGVGLNAQLLTVNSITNTTAAAIPLSTQSGTSFELIAGAGGMTLSRPIIAHQNVVITTSGTVTVDDTIDTTAANDNVTITAGNLVLGPSGAVNVGTGSCSLNGGACSSGSGGSGRGSSGLPPDVELASTQPENVLVASTDEAVTAPAPIAAGTEESAEEDPEVKKKPVCTGGGKAAASAAVGGSVSRRCTSRGCF